MNQLAKLSNSPVAELDAADRELAERCDKATATQTVALILGSYPNRNIPDADVYVRQIVALLCCYPRCVAEQIAHPINGIVADKPFLPSLSEVKAFAERMVAGRERSRELMATRVPPERRLEVRLSDEERQARAERLARLKDELAAAPDPVTRATEATAMSKPKGRVTQAEHDRRRAEVLRECHEAGISDPSPA